MEQLNLKIHIPYHYIDTLEFKNEEDAYDYAYKEACELYYSYEGYHGLFNREDALEEDPYLTDDELTEMEDEDRENWIKLLKISNERDFNSNYLFSRLIGLPSNYNGEKYSIDLPVCKYGEWSSFFVMEIKNN